MRAHLVALGAAACLLAVAGCRDDHSGGDEREHAGHLIPAHKPKTFPDAVLRLRELHRQMNLSASRGAESSPKDDGSMAIAIDIANWLPEIAADSDMPKRPWDRVNDQAGVLLASYELLAGKRPGDPRAASAAAERALADLEGLLAGADPSWFDGPNARKKSP